MRTIILFLALLTGCTATVAEPTPSSTAAPLEVPEASIRPVGHHCGPYTCALMDGWGVIAFDTGACDSTMSPEITCTLGTRCTMYSNDNDPRVEVCEP